MANALQIIRKFYPDVESVRDSKRNLMIEVTEIDAKSKAVKSHKECALAHACKRMLDVDGAIIAVKYAYLIKGNKAVRYSVPESVAREITSFDRNAGFEIGTYHLAKVPPSGELGAAKRKYGKPTGEGRKVYENLHRTENIRHIQEEE